MRYCPIIPEKYTWVSKRIADALSTLIMVYTETDQAQM